MIDLFLISQLIASNPETQKFCADFVGIPYASDTFTDKQWNEFQSCMLFFERSERRPQAPTTPTKLTEWI